MAANPRIVPAQLSFLAIYNPILGASDDTLQDQILFYSAKDGGELKQKSRSKHLSVYDHAEEHGNEEAQNERLRQVGLAQGMVDFAKNFSNGKPVDSIDTDKSRIVLHELEPSWWILASIDLTQLPRASLSGDSGSTQGAVEYSAREVSPPQLLTSQLVQAHSQFLLHHAPNFWDLYNRVGRETFCNLLDRFWSRFVWNWDVLLHGNPVVEIYNGVKISGCGELGIGVGEEEWGSGEREVLEGFVGRTEGLVDLVVGRFGDAIEETDPDSNVNKQVPPRRVKQRPWLGQQESSRASDGIVFSGTGAVTRRSLATVSQWMEAIFREGNNAYGVGENPSSRPRHRGKKTRSAEHKKPAEIESTRGQGPVSSQRGTSNGADARKTSLQPKTGDLRRSAIKNDTASRNRDQSPGIPPPLVGAVESSLARATDKAEAGTSPKLEKTEDQANQAGDSESYFDRQKVMKYLSLGYGSSWTLNPKGWSSDTESTKELPKAAVPPPQEADKVVTDSATAVSTEADDHPYLQQLDPTPEVNEDEVGFVQRLEQSIGKFLIGLSGDLENTEFDDEDSDNESNPQRIFLRTVTLEMSKSKTRQRPNTGPRSLSRGSKASTVSRASEEPKTSAAASVDGAQINVRHEKLQVAVYVHQPFMFVFLFELHKPTLTMPYFYRNLHHQLGPLQKPLLRSTDPTRMHDRLAEYTGSRTTTSSHADDPSNTIHDLIYDPIKLTIRTTVPDIPPPGSLAAEGLSSATISSWSGSWYTLGIPIGASASPTNLTSTSLIRTDWTRVEALGVHTQLLNTFNFTRSPSASSDIERTVKTGRGWWIVWMKTVSKHPTDTAREAFLVRKARDYKGMTGKTKGLETSGKWLLREQPRDVSGSSMGSGIGETTAKGVSEGLGVDARRLVEGLSKLIQ